MSAEAVVSKSSVTIDTVEALVRHRMAMSLGGKRGLLEAGIPGLIFTAVWLPTRELQWAVLASLAVAGVALVIRLAQRSTVQFVFNAIFGIGIGWLFVRWAQSAGASPDEQALRYFLPGIIISLVYTVVFAASCLAGWPFFGFLLGAATEDPFGWRENPQIVQLCTRLTVVFALPGAVGVLIQGPIWLAAHYGAMDTDLAVVLLAVLRTGLGWVLRIASWSFMIWLVARNATPLEDPEAA